MLSAVLVESEKMPVDSEVVRGYDFNKPFNFDEFISAYLSTGFQATNLSLAIEEINKMVANPTNLLTNNILLTITITRFTGT